MSARAYTLHQRPSRQRGVVLFVALIAMVIMSLAGVALLRSMDTSTGVAGNVAFRQASIGPVNLAIESAIENLFRAKTINPVADNAALGYFASLQANEKVNGVPEALAGNYPPSKYGATVVKDKTSGIEVRSVIERVCNSAGAATIANCDLLPPKVSPGGTDNEVGRIPLPPIPHYRVTVRVDLPNTNTVSFAQAFVRGQD